MGDGGNAETGLLEEEPLDLVGQPGRLPGAQVAGPRDPGDMPDPLAQQRSRLGIRQPAIFDQLEHPGTAQLSDLLLEGHLADEALHPVGHG